jgi:cytochrome c-type biogenesis protein CcmH
VRERLKSGDSDAQVLEFLTSRYGEFVLLRPSLSVHNVLLWFAPAVLLIAGAAGLMLASRRRRVVPIDAAPLSADEERRIQDVINR